jgi:putative phosphoesterase
MKLLVLSDIHGNWPALEAVLQAEPDFDAVAFCGDVVDYGPCPVECIRWLRGHADHLVRGNHDNALGFDLDCRCMGSFREASVATRAWHRTLVGETERAFLRGMLTLDWFAWQGRHFRMAHATPQGDLFEYLPMDAWGERVAGLADDYVLLGHTHVQGLRGFGRTTVVNPGSVGLARDRGGEACYAVFEADQMILKRVPYDVDRTVALLRAAPLLGPVLDMLVVLVVGQEAGAPRSLVRARAIGVMRMREEKGQDNKLIAVHVDDPEYGAYRDIADLPPHRLRELRRFFLDYKVLEGEEVVVEAPLGAAEALPILRDAIAYYAQHQEELRSGRRVTGAATR